jgi:lysophospholipase L1-like esterase
MERKHWNLVLILALLGLSLQAANPSFESIANLHSNTLPSSAGQWWTRTVPSLSAYSLPTNMIRQASMSGRLKVAVIGSSLVSGLGSTGDTNGWVSIVSNRLNSAGISFINCGITGNTAANVRTRIVQDVLPLQPTHCIISLALGNEGIVGSAAKVAICQNWLSNIVASASILQGNGIIPIIAMPYVRSDMDANDYQLTKEMAQAIDELPFISIDFLDVLDNGSGDIPAAYDSGDGIHPNNAGYYAMSLAISEWMFRVPSKPVLTMPDQQQSRGAQYSGAAIALPATYQLNNVSDWTTAFWVRNTDGVIAKAIWNISGNTFRLRDTSFFFQLTDNAAVDTISPIAAQLTPWVHFAFSFKADTGILTWFTNGSQFATVTNGFTASSNLTQVFWGRYDNAAANSTDQLRDILLWRAALKPWQVSNLYSGNLIWKAALDGAFPLSEYGWGGSNIAQNAFANGNFLVMNQGAGFTGLKQRGVATDDGLVTPSLFKTVASFYSNSGNTNTTESYLYSSSIPYTAWPVSGASFTADYGLSIVNSTSTKQVRLYLGTNMVFDSGTLTISASSAMNIRANFTRVTSSSYQYTVTANTTGASTGTYASSGSVVATDIQAPNTLLLTGAAAGVGAASNDIIARIGVVRSSPAP